MVEAGGNHGRIAVLRTKFETRYTDAIDDVRRSRLPLPRKDEDAQGYAAVKKSREATNRLRGSDPRTYRIATRLATPISQRLSEMTQFMQEEGIPPESPTNRKQTLAVIQDLEDDMLGERDSLSHLDLQLEARDGGEVFNERGESIILPPNQAQIDQYTLAVQKVQQFIEQTRAVQRKCIALLPEKDRVVWERRITRKLV